jgi:hypothetical protein
MSTQQIQILNNTLQQISEFLESFATRNPSVQEEFAFPFTLMVSQCQSQAEDLLSQLEFAGALLPTETQQPATEDLNTSVCDDSIRENFEIFATAQNIEKFDHNNPELDQSITSLLSMKDKYDELDDLLMYDLDDESLVEKPAEISLKEISQKTPKKLTLKEKIALKKNPIEDFKLQKISENSDKKNQNSNKSTTDEDSDGSDIDSAKKPKLPRKRGGKKHKAKLSRKEKKAKSALEQPQGYIDPSVLEFTQNIKKVAPVKVPKKITVVKTPMFLLAETACPGEKFVLSQVTF